MSLVFNNTSSPYNGIIQQIELTLFGPDGLTRISGNSVQLGIWTGRINRWMDRTFTLIFEADGRWQFDDSNHTDYPTITTSLTANRRDYAFTSDENGNLILEVHKVAILPSSGASAYVELTPADTADPLSPYVENNTSVTGTPETYDKLGNAIFLDPIPSSTIASGLKVYISREGSYFTTGDTTKKPGFHGLYHDILFVGPCYEYALDNALDKANGLSIRLARLEDGIKEAYSRRAKDERSIIKGKRINYL